jgi:hypothetical protein
VAKDPKPENGRASSGASRGGSGSSRPSGQRGGGQAGKGRTRPPVDVVSRQKPWGLIAAAAAVVVFAVAVLTYAVVSVNKANADKVTALSQIKGLTSYEYAAGQQHVTTPVTYTESPPVGGPHDPEWADCTGTVYTVDIRHENALHSLEHGAVWIAYNPDTFSLQSWNLHLFVQRATDERVQQFADFLVFNDSVKNHYPEIGASCENPTFITDPLVQGDSSRSGTSGSVATDAPTTPTAATDAPSSTTAATP